MKNAPIASILFLLTALMATAPVCAASGTAKSPDGVPISYESSGEGSPALVFVHGWSCDRGLWKDQVEYFAEKTQVVTLDLGGHGNSGKNRNAWSIESFGSDVAAVVENLGLKDVVLVGHSMGGLVVLEAAGLLPGRIRCVIGIDTLQDPGRKLGDDQISQVLAPFRSNFTGMARLFAANLFAADADPSLVRDMAARMAAFNPDIGVQALESSLKFNAEAAILRAGPCICCINSDKVPTNTEAWKKLVPAFGLKLMSGRGHFLMLEDPAGLNRILEETIPIPAGK